VAIKLALLSVDIPARATIDIVTQVILTGNYPSGGEIVDFSTLAGQQSQEGGMLDSDLLPSYGFIQSVAAQFGYNYELQLYTAAAVPVPLTWKTCKLRITYNQVGLGTISTEFAAGAYPSAILQDYITMVTRFWRQR
jgi:hypothetical protein